jgi:hypothetical protein
MGEKTHAWVVPMWNAQQRPERVSESCISKYTNPTALHPPPLNEASAAMLTHTSSGGVSFRMELEEGNSGAVSHITPELLTPAQP